MAKFKENNLHCGDIMKRIHEKLERNANQQMQKSGVTLSQLKLLVVLSMTEDGTATLKEMEKFFEVAQSTAAGIAVRLEKKGYIDSCMDAEDKRIKHLRITEKGREVCRTMRGDMEAQERELLSNLSEEERVQFRDMLQRVYEAIH